MKEHKINVKVCFFIPNFEIGGIEVSYMKLCNNLITKIQNIELVYCEDIGPLRKDFDSRVNMVCLNKTRMATVILALKQYYETSKPDIFITPMFMLGNAAIIARILSSHKPKIIIGARSTFSEVLKSFDSRFKYVSLYLLSRILFPLADKIISVSNGVRNDLSSTLNIDLSKINTIYNPVIDNHHIKANHQLPNHPWFRNKSKDCKIIICIGRLAEEKAFDEVIDVFSKINDPENVKLLIIGEGMLKSSLIKLIDALELNEKVQILDFQTNYLSFLAFADIFVLNSKFEGLPGILIEALALDCRVISSNCDHGPKEILLNGKHGILFPVGNKDALLQAIEFSLKEKDYKNSFKPFDSNFTVRVSTQQYLQEINKLIEDKS